MARNKARDFATITEDLRARFEGGPALANGAPLDMDPPRDGDRMGRHHADPDAEVADPDNRDGTAAELDTPAHQRAVERERRDRRPDTTR